MGGWLVAAVGIAVLLLLLGTSAGRGWLLAASGQTTLEDPMPLVARVPSLTLQAKVVLVGLLVLAILVGLTALGVLDWPVVAGAGGAAAGGWTLARQRAQRRAEAAGHPDTPPTAEHELAQLAREGIAQDAERARQETASALDGTGPSPADVARSRRGQR